MKYSQARALIIPPAADRIAACDGWELFDRGPAGDVVASPLWPSLKAVHVARRGQRCRGAGRRAYWLRYGVVAGRFRQCMDAKEFCTRFPAVYAAFEERCRRFHTVEKWRHRLGDMEFDQEAARLQLSAAKRAGHTADRVERAHAAAIAENELWERLYGG